MSAGRGNHDGEGMNKKKFARLAALAMLVLMIGSIVSAHAEIIPPYGEGQIGLGGDEENLLLVWYSDVTPEETVVFERVDQQ